MKQLDSAKFVANHWTLLCSVQYPIVRKSAGIKFKESIPPAYVASAGIFKQSLGTRNQVRIGLSYRARILNF